MANDETYAGEFYCVKCKEKRTAEGKVVVSENGRRMAKDVYKRQERPRPRGHRGP